MAGLDDWWERLRRVPVMTGPLPDFEPQQAGDDPGALFDAWLSRALADGLPEPHLMTLGTVDAQGRPSSRVLLLRGFDPRRCAYLFAGDAASRKGTELAGQPYAALSWYWSRHGRQVRVAGPVEALDRRAARADFLGRSELSRVAGFVGEQSAVLPGAETYRQAWTRARRTVAADPDAVPEGHTVYLLHAAEAEFFQGVADRAHRRLRYVREGERWRREQLWP